MKKLTIAIVSLSLIALVLIGSSYSEPSRGYYRPVYMKRADLEKSVSYTEGKRDMENPGKIYVRQPYVFVNERYKGIHVIDNTNPQSPVAIGFIVAPGCLDIAVKGDVIYLDNAVDLVAFDFLNKKETGRVREYFPRLSPPNSDYYNPGNAPDDFVIVEWKRD